jgi:hypothetical protein
LTLIRLGGAALVLAAVAFSAVFAFLATQFHYPEVLDAPAAQALPALLAMGETGRAVWAVYGVLPLLLVPASLGAYAALKRASQGGMALAVLMAVIAAVAMMLGLMRWPSIQWEIARVYATASPEGRALLTAVFDGLNRYLGNYLGEFVGELCLSTFFFLSGRAMLRSDGFARWMGWAGVASGAIGWIAMWRNVTAIVAPVAQVNNAVLPIWMIVFGIGLLRVERGMGSAQSDATRKNRIEAARSTK